MILGNALRREAHRLQRRREDRAERDIIGLGGERGLQLGIVMRREAERQPRLLDRGDVGLGEILLAEMKMLGASDDRRAPVVVDDQPGRRALGDRQRVGDDLQRLAVIEVLGAQLDGADAELASGARPRRGCRRRDRSDQDTACQNGVPTTGVEGEAKSRASISPAS